MSKESNMPERIKKSFQLLGKDIWTLKYVILVFVFYLWIGKNFMYTLCPTVTLTGFPCPGCGMTRAVFSVLRGNFVAAWHLHPFVYVLGIYIFVFIFRRYILQKEVKCMIKYLILIAFLMVGFYVYRMVRYFPGDAPISYYYGSVLYRLLNK